MLKFNNKFRQRKNLVPCYNIIRVPNKLTYKNDSIKLKNVHRL